MFPDMFLITITLRLMFVPLAVGKPDMVCFIVASWPHKILRVGTPACWNNSSSSSISSKILLSSCSNWVLLRTSEHVSQFPPKLDTSLSVSSVLGFGVLFTPVPQSLLANSKMAGLLEEMYSWHMDAFFQEIYQLLCYSPFICCPGSNGKCTPKGQVAWAEQKSCGGTLNIEFWVVNISVFLPVNQTLPMYLPSWYFTLSK